MARSDKVNTAQALEYFVDAVAIARRLVRNQSSLAAANGGSRVFVKFIGNRLPQCSKSERSGSSTTRRTLLGVITVGVALGVILTPYGPQPWPWPTSPRSQDLSCGRDWQTTSFESDDFHARLRPVSQETADHMRTQVINFIWKMPRLPTDAASVETRPAISLPVFDGHPNLARIDELIVDLPYGFTARIPHLIPVAGNDRLAIFHHGHGGSAREPDSVQMINSLLVHGFEVVVFDMPMRGRNTWPAWIDVPEIGPVSFAAKSHWSLSILESADFSPLLYFLDPVLRTINHLSAARDYEETVMVGFSGGGWTTTVYAALDARITKSYPVAGTLPFALHGADDDTSGSIGDFEQRHPGLFTISSYIDLYILGAAGDGRRQVQILNEFDTCCFPGAWAWTYADLVSDAVRDLELGGSWQLFIDRGSRAHQLSAKARQFIVNDALSEPARCPANDPLNVS